jgi:hypothetical protein
MLSDELAQTVTNSARDVPVRGLREQLAYWSCLRGRSNLFDRADGNPVRLSQRSTNCSRFGNSQLSTVKCNPHIGGISISIPSEASRGVRRINSRSNHKTVSTEIAERLDLFYVDCLAPPPSSKPKKTVVTNIPFVVENSDVPLLQGKTEFVRKIPQLVNRRLCTPLPSNRLHSARFSRNNLLRLFAMFGFVCVLWPLAMLPSVVQYCITCIICITCITNRAASQ